MATLAGSSSSGLARPPTMLEQLLEEINFQRTKELRQMLKDGSYGFENIPRVFRPIRIKFLSFGVDVFKNGRFARGLELGEEGVHATRVCSSPRRGTTVPFVRLTRVISRSIIVYEGKTSKNESGYGALASICFRLGNVYFR